MSAVHTAIVDWDGTAVPACWPDQPKAFMPGFVANMHRLHRAGIHIKIASARLTPFDPWTGAPADPAHIEHERRYMRDLLDSHGLTFIDIWTQPGKPSGSVYIDDKAERYGGCKKCWNKVTDKVLMRLGKEDAMFPAFQQEAQTD